MKKFNSLEFKNVVNVLLKVVFTVIQTYVKHMLDLH